MRSRSLTACLAVTFVAAGCKQASEADAPTPPPSTSKQAAQPASQPAAAPHGAVGSDAPPGAPFSGLLKLGDGITAEDVSPTDVLFVMARESQGGGLAGRLVAVQRLGKTEYPMRYEIGPKDVMVPGIPFAGPFIVNARLDKDGDPMTRGPDDLYAFYPDPVKPGTEGVHLVLTKGAPKTVKAPPGAKAPGSRGAASMPAGQGGAASQPAP